MSPTDCVACGCDGFECDPKACADISDNNPDVCEGCNTCAGDWDIDDDRGTTPWTIGVTGELDIASGGHIIVGNSAVLAVGSARLRITHALHVSTGTFKIVG